jgi:hypothetical protein
MDNGIKRSRLRQPKVGSFAGQSHLNLKAEHASEIVVV